MGKDDGSNENGLSKKEMEKMMKKQTDSVRAMLAQSGNSYGYQNNYRSSGSAMKTCYKCGKSGHVQKDCYSNNYNNNKVQKANNHAGMTCHHCGKTGHIRKNCWSLNGKNKGKGKSKGKGKGKGGKGNRN